MKREPSSKCDRRMSRVARFILVQNALPVFKYYHQRIVSSFPPPQNPTLASITDPTLQAGNNRKSIHRSTLYNTKNYASELQLYSLLFSSIVNRLHSTSARPPPLASSVAIPPCILDPKRDPYWIGEQEYYSTRTRTMTTLSRFLFQSSSSLLEPQILHVCGKCGKAFMSRHYLDLHQDTCLTKINERIEQSSMIYEDVCPATDWCSFLGFCSYLAPEMEPLLSIDSTHVSCNRVEMDQSRTFCYETIQTCFQVSDEAQINKNNGNDVVTSLRKALSDTLCAIQTCENLIHSMALSHSHPSKTRFETLSGLGKWNVHQSHYSTVNAWMLVLWILLLIAWILTHFLSVRPWNRILQKTVVDESKRKKLH